MLTLKYFAVFYLKNSKQITFNFCFKLRVILGIAIFFSDTHIVIFVSKLTEN